MFWQHILSINTILFSKFLTKYLIDKIFPFYKYMIVFLDKYHLIASNFNNTMLINIMKYFLNYIFKIPRNIKGIYRGDLFELNLLNFSKILYI
jgi:hypothetical protein